MVIVSYESAVTLNLTWPTKIKNILSEIGMFEDFLLKRNNTHLNAYQRMSDIFHQGAFSQIGDENSKLRTYNTFKNKICFEEYLDNVHNVRDRVKTQIIKSPT